MPLVEGGSLSSYENLGKPDGLLGKTQVYTDREGLGTARTISIVPTRYTTMAAARVKSDENRNLVANALDRTMCIALSDRFEVVPFGQPADLTVKAMITDVVPTDVMAAGMSKVTSLGSSAFLPVGLPRLPIGLGGLSVEAEAVDAQDIQRAAIVWARGANSFTNSPRISEIGDAYGLASSFSSKFGDILSTGKIDPGLQIPSAQEIMASLGSKPKYKACEAFGAAPGLLDVVGGAVAAPPAWTDASGQKAKPPAAARNLPDGQPAQQLTSSDRI